METWKEKCVGLLLGCWVLVGLGMMTQGNELGWAGVVVVGVGLFHALEYATIRWAHGRATVHAFLLANPAYWLALAFGFYEWWVLDWPRHEWVVVRVLGLLLLASGQLGRSVAMVQAGASFTHYIEHGRRTNHALVQHGLYASMRHPSYAFFLLWALGTQLLLANVYSPILFVLVLWLFFFFRIRSEEASLRSIFPDSYSLYAKNVRSGIPGIP